jgi:formylglycine-generating enzyme required for sulfatase activity
MISRLKGVLPWTNSWFQMSLFISLVSLGFLIADLAGQKFTSVHWPGFQDLFPAQHPTAGRDWTNSLGVVFKPVPGVDVLFSEYDVRVGDFSAFVKATNYNAVGHDPFWVMYSFADAGTVGDPRGATWSSPGFAQTDDCPVVGVSCDDATAFCDWLTKKEQADGRLSANQSYRLPTEAEWTAAAGPGKYPWGDQWPPPPDAGNYADQAFAQSMPSSTGGYILPDNDGYARTSPVGKFRANSYGLYDMGGNVWQWCMDWYEPAMNPEDIRERDASMDNLSMRDGRLNGAQADTYKPLRGDSWAPDRQDKLLSAYTDILTPVSRSDRVGFRPVLVITP